MPLPPPTPPRKKRVSYDVGLLNEKLGSVSKAGGGSQRLSGHRKSSIPFADRAPRVRFVREEVQYRVADIGTHNPHFSQAVEGPDVHPILKKNYFPIAIDKNSLQHLGGNCGSENTNEQLETCVNYVEQLIQYFSKAEREARGSMDILTFPVISGTVEPLARFEGSIILAVLAISHVKSTSGKTTKPMLSQVITITDKLLNDINNFYKSVKALLKRVKQRCNQFDKLLSKKGDFQINDRRRSIVPIYTKKTMPESVTLYEHEIEEDTRFRFDGVTKIYRVSTDIIVLVDVQNEESVMKYPNEIDEEQLCVIAEEILNHAKDLIFFAHSHLNLALDTLNESSFDSDFNELSDKITNIDFDAFFDPLCALELKNALGDVVARKGELLNSTEHILKYFKWTIQFTKLFLKYCKQVDAKLIMSGGGDKGCCTCGLITAEKLLDMVPSLCSTDFMITLPVTDRFLNLLFHIQLEPSKSKIKLLKS